jgi:hypothetical protein
MDLLLCGNIQGLFSVVGGDGLVSFAAQINLQRGDNIRVVVADQNPIHPPNPPSRFLLIIA